MPLNLNTPKSQDELASLVRIPALPTEVYDVIIDSLIELKEDNTPTRDTLVDLLSCMSVNGYFRSICIRHLLSRIVVGILSSAYYGSTVIKHIFSLLKSEPKYAHYVRELTLDFSKYTGDTHAEHFFIIEKRQLSNLQALRIRYMPSLGLDQEVFESTFKSRSLCNYVIQTYLRSNCIQTLELDRGVSIDTNAFQAIVDSQSLKRITFRGVTLPVILLGSSSTSSITSLKLYEIKNMPMSVLSYFPNLVNLGLEACELREMSELEAVGTKITTPLLLKTLKTNHTSNTQFEKRVRLVDLLQYLEACCGNSENGPFGQLQELDLTADSTDELDAARTILRRCTKSLQILTIQTDCNANLATSVFAEPTDVIYPARKLGLSKRIRDTFPHLNTLSLRFNAPQVCDVSENVMDDLLTIFYNIKGRNVLQRIRLCLYTDSVNSNFPPGGFLKALSYLLAMPSEFPALEFVDFELYFVMPESEPNDQLFEYISAIDFVTHAERLMLKHLEPVYTRIGRGLSVIAQFTDNIQNGVENSSEAGTI